MTTLELCRYLLDEEASEEWLRRKNILKIFDSCSICGSQHLGRIRRERYKCYECQGEWNIRKGSWLESMHLDCTTLIGAIKMYSVEMPAIKCAYELEVSRRTILRLYEDFRELLVGPPESFTDENKVAVMITLVGKDVNVRLSPIVDEFIGRPAKLFLKRQKQSDGQYYYSTIYSSITAKKILCAIDKIDHLDEFYRFCQERLLRFRGRDSVGMFGILQELAFRFNHRNDQVFDVLVDRLAAPVKAVDTRGALI